MYLFDRTRTALRTSSRSLIARLPASVGRQAGPASLAIHASPWLPGDRVQSLGAPAHIDRSALRNALVDAVAALGPLPVRVFTLGRALDEHLRVLVRLAHRLECPVQVWTDGRGVTSEGAFGLVDAGADSVVVMVAGLDDDTQARIVGNSATEATDAVVALVAARADRDAPTRVCVGIPWRAGVESEVRGIVGWARQLGVDDILLVPPVRGGDVGPGGEWEDTLRTLGVRGADAATWLYLDQLRTQTEEAPGIPKADAPAGARFRPCPIVGARLAFSLEGAVACCPHKAPAGNISDGILHVWRHASEHRADVHGCARRCRHPALGLGGMGVWTGF